MNDERITWPIAAKDAREAALEAWRYGDDRDAEDAAHEYADGCADVIYYGRALALYVRLCGCSDRVRGSGRADAGTHRQRLRVPGDPVRVRGDVARIARGRRGG